MKTTARPFSGVSDERGMALPMTMIVLTLITTLAMAFLALAATEPVIANNHMLSAQARAMAESGIERGLWALSSGTVPDLDENQTAASPYNGGTYFSMGAKGGFTITITREALAAANERTLVAVGYLPSNVNPTSQKQIRIKASRFKKLDPPCAICAGGEQPPGTSTDIRIGGSAHVKAATSAGAAFCGDAPPPQAAVMSQGTVSTNGSPELVGPNGGDSKIEGVNANTFKSFIFSDDEMAMLRDMAKATGTYLKGSQSYSFTSPPPNGIVFIDTPSGNAFNKDSPSSDIVNVDIHGNWSQGWSGWLIVAGSVQLSGNVMMTGLLYAQNDVTLHGTGNSGFSGAVISTNRMDTQSSRVADVEDIGNAPITYNCPAVRDGGGTISQRWFPRPGTFREVPS